MDINSSYALTYDNIPIFEQLPCNVYRQQCCIIIIRLAKRLELISTTNKKDNYVCDRGGNYHTMPIYYNKKMYQINMLYTLNLRNIYFK